MSATNNQSTPQSHCSYADAVALRASQATPILQQIRSDVTRYRYGDEQHLDEALDRIFRINKSGGIRRNQCPVLSRLREEVVNDKYALVLGFDSALPIEEWEVRFRSRFNLFCLCSCSDATFCGLHAVPAGQVRVILRTRRVCSSH